jgi:hypothetical protein
VSGRADARPLIRGRRYITNLALCLRSPSRLEAVALPAFQNGHEVLLFSESALNVGFSIT